LFWRQARVRRLNVVMANIREHSDIGLRAIYVNHGLQKQADCWAKHCGEVCAALSVPYDTAKARDCSNAKGFHAKMMCKLTGDSVSSATSDKPKKEGNGFWQKIKNFGGKNINEPG